VKTFCLIAILAATTAAAARAQSDTNAAPQPAAAPGQIIIEAERLEFDMTNHTATYFGSVHVTDPQMNLTCGWLVADLPESGGRVSHIVAETNVVIDFTDDKGQKMHATSDKAVYDFLSKDSVTNETVTLTGNAKVERAQGWLTGEPIFWDRAGNHLTATNPKMIFRQNLIPGATANTNAPPATNATGMDTNFPPGKLDLVPPTRPGSVPPEPSPPKP
jgi:lipopolysaccharide transport protein LptA